MTEEEVEADECCLWGGRAVVPVQVEVVVVRVLLRRGGEACGTGGERDFGTDGYLTREVDAPAMGEELEETGVMGEVLVVFEPE